MLGTLHRLTHQVDEMYRVFAELRPVLEAYSRGGLLAARTAAKRGTGRG
jgi:pimeloyl-ACP methyl ester carboxylesterase